MQTVEALKISKYERRFLDLSDGHSSVTACGLQSCVCVWLGDDMMPSGLAIPWAVSDSVAQGRSFVSFFSDGDLQSPSLGVSLAPVTHLSHFALLATRCQAQ